MKTIKGYEIKKRKGLSHWDAMLTQWASSIEKFCLIAEGDAPYWYNERANVGVLAHAAWRDGCVVLEEFQSEKGFKNKTKWYGRGDLWLRNKGRDELVEAKFSWVSLKARRELSQIVDEYINLATKDAARSRGGNNKQIAIGVAFFPVYVKGKYKEQIDILINDAIESFSGLDCHAIAWCFPKETRKVIHDGGNICPGVFMAVKNVDHGKN